MKLSLATALAITACCTVGFVSACNPAHSSEASAEPASEWPKLYRPSDPGLPSGPEFVWTEGRFEREPQTHWMHWGGVTYRISGELFRDYVREDGYAPKGVERSATVERVEESRAVMGVIR